MIRVWLRLPMVGVPAKLLESVLIVAVKLPMVMLLKVALFDDVA